MGEEEPAQEMQLEHRKAIRCFRHGGLHPLTMLVEGLLTAWFDLATRLDP